MTWPPDPTAPPDTDIRAFFAAIRDAGDDTTPRLVFADWLEERGDPRAELVRLQVALRTADAEKERDTLTKRIEEWKRMHEETWFGKKVKLCTNWAKSTLSLSSDDDDALCGSPDMASVRRALVEGWFETVGFYYYEDADFTEADGLGLLASLSQMVVLDDGVSLTDASLRLLGKHTELRELFLYSSAGWLTDAGVAELGRLRRLRSLTLCDQPSLTGAAFATFEGFADLCVLGFISKIDDSVLEELVRFPNLEELTIHRSPVRNKGLATVGRLTRLRQLDLCSCYGLTPTALAHLAGLRELRVLDLSQNDWITDGSLKHLAGLSHLEVLMLQNCTAVTGAGVRHLHGLANLRTLGLIGCSLKPHDTRALRKALPNCEVVRKL